MGDWLVQEHALATPARSGGMHAEKGFVFQRTYAAWLLTSLLIGTGGLAALRYEGSQDVDLRFQDGTEIYVQVKAYEAADFDWQAVRGIVASFASDLRAACMAFGDDAARRLSFRLVAIASVSDVRVLDLLRRVRISSHSKSLAIDLPTGVLDKTLERDVRMVLERVDGQLFPAGFPKDVFRLMTEAFMVRFGVLPDDVDDILASLIDRIEWRRTIRAADVLDWLADRLPKGHPFSVGGAIVPFVAKARSRSGSPDLFYTSRSDVWEGIANDLDVPRDAAETLRGALISTDGGTLLVHGPSGAGKSTLVRRVMWDLQREGRILALETGGGDLDDAEWTETIRFAKRMAAQGGPPTVILIDDVHSGSTMAQRISQLEPDPGLRVVATAWSSQIPSLDLGPSVRKFLLSTISRKELDAVGLRLGRDPTVIPTAELNRLLQSGQFIVLNIALVEGGDIASFGRRLLDSVEFTAPTLVGIYVDLCACGIDDLSVPMDVMRRVHPNALVIVDDPRMTGLVFTAGPGRLRSGHRLLAQAVMSASSTGRLSRLIELATKVDPENASERRFGIALLENMVASDHFSEALVLDIERLAWSFAHSGQYLDIRRCVRVLIAMGRHDKAGAVDALAVFARVETGPDAAAYRGDRGRSDPTGVFDALLGFYMKHPTTWGWRNLLQMAKDLDPERREQALELAWRRLDRSSDIGTAKVAVDLMNSGGALPTWSVEFATSILRHHPDSIAIARSVAQLIKDHLRSPRVFEELLEYATPLVGVAGDGLLLSRDLASASRCATPTDRRRLLHVLLTIVEEASAIRIHPSLLLACASLAEPEDATTVERHLGPVEPNEARKLNAARHILKRKTGTS